jgi:hypothetical protein
LPGWDFFEAKDGSLDWRSVKRISGEMARRDKSMTHLMSRPPNTVTILSD